MLKIIATLLFLYLNHFPELNDTPMGATQFMALTGQGGYTHGVIDYPLDPEYFLLKAPHNPSIIIQVDTGVGFLCGCPKGDVLNPFVYVFDEFGNLLGWDVGTSYGTSTITIYHPSEKPIFILVSGIPHTLGYSEFNINVL